jgi:fluoride ion exporter CrcB/FEX
VNIAPMRFWIRILIATLNELSGLTTPNPLLKVNDGAFFFVGFSCAINEVAKTTIQISKLNLMINSGFWSSLT